MIIISASCTTNCLAPGKGLNSPRFSPVSPWSIHAYRRPDILDGPQRKGNMRRSRAAAINIVPNSTGAAKAIGLVVPELNGKLIGSRSACSGSDRFYNNPYGCRQRASYC